MSDPAHEHAVRAMAGFDDLPPTLRLFLHEHADALTEPQLMMVLSILRAGRSVEVKTPAGKRVKLEPH